MPLSVMIVDYKKARRDFIGEAVKFVSKGAVVEKVNATERDGDQPQDFEQAAMLAQKEVDLVVYNTMSNPSPKLFIEEFKKNFPMSHVFLYRDLDTIQVNDFNEYRLADGMATVKDADLADDEKAKGLADALKASLADSPTVKVAWLKKVAETMKDLGTAMEGISKVTAGLIAFGTAVAGVIGGFLVSESGIWV